MRKPNLQRFYDAHAHSYAQALAEIQKGRKQSHWMWFIFPQIKGLGWSSTAQYYAIESSGEARAFLEDPYLGGNLRRVCGELLKCRTKDPEAVFGYTDALKLCSSMTLFHCAGGGAEENRIFQAVLDRFYAGKMDNATIRILNGMEAD